MSFLCCNCLINLFSSDRNKNTFKKPYKPQSAQDLDQEELMASNISKQAKELPAQYFTPQQPSEDHEKQMNVELQLNQQNTKYEDDKYSQPSSRGENDHFVDLQDQDKSENEQIPSQQKLKPDYTKFSINLDPYDKFYKLLHQKTDNLEKYFTLQGIPIDFGQTKANVKVEKLDNKSKIDNNKFSVRFQLPCSYSFYSMLTKDSNLNNKKYMTHFQKHQILEAFKPNFTKNVTRMKRFSMLEPREFVYLKYSNGSFKQNWQICINDPEEDLLSQQQPTEHKRCDIFSVSNFKEINDRLYVRQYIEIDLKSGNMNANIWGKIMHEVKEYLQKLYQHVQNYYQKQLL